MTDLATPRAIDGPEQEPEPSPPLLIDPPSVRADGVELTRLLHRAQLTAAQAVELAAAVASELARRAGSDAGAAGGAPVPAGPVLIGSDGRVVPGAGGDGAGALLPGIADSVRARARLAGPAAEQLVVGLDGAVATLPDAGVAAVARKLREVAEAIDRRAVRAEIGALVRAIDAEGDPVGGRAPAAARAAAGRATAAERTGPGRARTVRRRTGAWLLSLVALTGVVLLEVGFLRGHILTDIGTLLDAGRGGSTPTASATNTPDGRPIAAPAPASAGPVAGIDLRPLQPCAPGAACSVRVDVRLTTAAAQQVVAWSYRVVDRCTGTAATAPGGSLTLPAGAQRASVVGTVALPAVPGVAVIAVTRQPAAAASAPLVVGSCTTHR